MMHEATKLPARVAPRGPLPIDETGPRRSGSVGPVLTVAAACALALLLMRRVLVSWAGDAVIHLRIAELLARGRPFEFNIGETVSASTSLLWTLLLAGLFRVLDPAAVALAVKLVCTAAWCGTALVMAICWTRIHGSRAAGALAATAYALSPAIFRNAVTGMEASLFALELVLLFGTVFAFPRGRWTIPGVLALTAAATLTRPEGAIFALLLAGFLLVRARRPSPVALAVIAGACVGVGAVLLANLVATGSVIPDSAAARSLAGLRDSIRIGPLHADPKSLLLLVAYLPLSLGLLASLAIRPAARPGLPATRPGLPATRPEPPAADGDGRAVRAAGADGPWGPAGFVLLLTAAMLAFYTFVTGAAHASRYWLPFHPFVFGVGAGTLVRLWRRARAAGARRVAAAGAAACVAWLALFYVADWQRRLRAPIGHPHGEVARAVEERPRFTARFLRELGVTPADPRPVTVAVTEVQLRYFLDDAAAIRVLSLDGRTAAGFDRYVDPETGLRRFDRYLREVRPDFIELGQFDPAEPVLPAVLAAWERGERDIVVDGFRFTRTGRPRVVRFVHDR